MKALLDTCVVVDFLQKREPFAQDALSLFRAVAIQEFSGYITAKSATDIFYLSHRATHSNEQSRVLLQRLLELVVEVRDGSQTLDYRNRALFLCIGGEKSLMHIDRHIVEILDAAVQKLHALNRAEIYVGLMIIVHDDDYHLVEHTRSASDYIEMTLCDGVEAAGTYGYFHAFLPSLR